MTTIIDPDLLLKFIEDTKLSDAEVGGLFRLFSRCWRDGWVSEVDIEHAIEFVDDVTLDSALADEWE